MGSSYGEARGRRLGGRCNMEYIVPLRWCVATSAGRKLDTRWISYVCFLLFLPTLVFRFGRLAKKHWMFLPPTSHEHADHHQQPAVRPPRGVGPRIPGPCPGGRGPGHNYCRDSTPAATAKMLAFPLGILCLSAAGSRSGYACPRVSPSRGIPPAWSKQPVIPTYTRRIGPHAPNQAGV